jgi:hypothetical protein
MLINGVGQMASGGNEIFETVWDGGGSDTYDFSGYGTSLRVDLQPGAWTVTSDAQRAVLGSGKVAVGNIANALLYNSDLRSLIENAIGGSGADTITGNQVANTLRGGSGNDVLYGLAGNDFLFGDAGSDTLVGGLGDDTFYFAVNNGADVIADFVAGAGSGDLIDLAGYPGMGTFSDVMDHAAQIGANTVITFGNGDVLTLNNVVRTNLVAGDFRYGNAVPVAAIVDHNLNANEWSTVTSWISYSDAEGNAAVQYQFWDGGTAATSGYFWTPSNPHHAAGLPITVWAAELANVWVRGGQVGGSETMWVRAYDGYGWGAWDAFTLVTTPNTPPVAAVSDHSLQANEWSQVTNRVSYSDAEGSAAVQYQFWDGDAAASSGYFWTPSNPHHDAGAPITVSAAQLADVWIRGGQVGGSEPMWVRAFDGTDWSAWDAFTFTTTGNTPPVATSNDHSLAVNQWSKVASWINYSDTENNLATVYEFWDGGAAATSGYFWTPSNPRHEANVPISVSAAELTDVWIRGAQTSSSETMWVRAFDGGQWGAWDAFSFVTV